MSEPVPVQVQSPPPQNFGQAISQHFQKHGTIYLIIIGALGVFVAVWIWQNNQSSGGTVANTGTGVNNVPSDQTQADYNSILTGQSGIASTLGQILTTLQNPPAQTPTNNPPASNPVTNWWNSIVGATAGPNGVRYATQPGVSEAQAAAEFGIPLSVFENLPGAASAFKTKSQPALTIPYNDIPLGHKG